MVDTILKFYSNIKHELNHQMDHKIGREIMGGYNK